MKIEDLHTELNSAVQSVATQRAYVEKLVEMSDEGTTEIRVFDEANQVWTVAPLADWHATQNAKLVELIAYQGSLSDIYDQLQALLDDAPKTVAVPK